MKDSKTLLLLFVSLCLVGTWIYHIYDKNNYLSNPEVIVVKDTAAIQKAVNDSIRKIYSSTLSMLDTSGASQDTSGLTRNSQVSEIDSLKTEIATILNINNITKEDLKKADEKIIQLQQRIKTQNETGVLKKSNTVDRTSTFQTTNQTENKNTETGKVENENALFSVSSLSINAIKSSAKENKATTFKANEAEEFAVTYSLVCRNSSFADAEIFLVLTDPSGNIIQDDQWQAGLFSTNNNIRIPYTRKNIFTYNKGEQKSFSTNLKLAEYNSGLYSLQVYHHGRRIGKADLRLN